MPCVLLYGMRCSAALGTSGCRLIVTEARRPQKRAHCPGFSSVYLGSLVLAGRRLASLSANFRASSRCCSCRLVGGILIPR